MTIVIGVFTGLSAIGTADFGNTTNPHQWGPWVAVSAGLIAMAVAS